MEDYQQIACDNFGRLTLSELSHSMWSDKLLLYNDGPLLPQSVATPSCLIVYMPEGLDVSGFGQ